MGSLTVRIRVAETSADEVSSVRVCRMTRIECLAMNVSTDQGHDKTDRLFHELVFKPSLIKNIPFILLHDKEYLWFKSMRLDQYVGEWRIQSHYTLVDAIELTISFVCRR